MSVYHVFNNVTGSKIVTSWHRAHTIVHDGARFSSTCSRIRRTTTTSDTHSGWVLLYLFGANCSNSTTGLLFTNFYMAICLAVAAARVTRLFLVYTNLNAVQNACNIPWNVTLCLRTLGVIYITHRMKSEFREQINRYFYLEFSLQ